MRFPVRLLRATLRRRYRRFFADVQLPDGKALTVHCPNPGSMLGLAEPGRAVCISDSGNPERKLRHTLELVQAGRTWVGVHTGRTNAVAAEALLAGSVVELAGFDELRREVVVGGGGSARRLDFLLEFRGRRPRDCYVEVKNVTLAEGSRALFPDSVTARGAAHLDELIRLRRAGHRACMLYVVNREDCDRLAFAAAIDPAYAAAARRAAQAGVELIAYSARVRPTGIALTGRLRVDLEPPGS